MYKHFPVTAATVLMAGVFLVALGPARVSAATCVDANWASYFDGFKTSSPIYGVTGTIRDRNIVLCSNTNGATSAASAWIMLAGGGSHEYAQIGYAKIAGMAATQTFTEYNDGEDAPPGWNRRFWPGIFSAGSTHSYSVVYGFSTGKISMSVGGSTLASTPWTPEQEWQTGWNAQYFGETLDRGDDVPGTVTSKANFTSLAALPCRGCSYGPPPNPFHPNPLSFYKFAWVTQPTSFDVWTER